MERESERDKRGDERELRREWVESFSLAGTHYSWKLSNVLN